jgi:hypothetical protein
MRQAVSLPVFKGKEFFPVYRIEGFTMDPIAKLLEDAESHVGA